MWVSFVRAVPATLCADSYSFSGLAVVFAEDIAGIKKDRKKPPKAWDNLCPKYDTLTEEQKGGILP
ncbi:hypothetical protein HGRIS_007069 [Hohenbuehelia grisea]|uniref:Uncharacterized protein n=1 Tax=Hohenbuehelia grisea TaxID=104357 RepID=A0ABR3JB19_9AGAR